MRQSRTLPFYQYTIFTAASPLYSFKNNFFIAEKALDKTVSLCYCIINVIQ